MRFLSLITFLLSVHLLCANVTPLEVDPPLDGFLEIRQNMHVFEDPTNDMSMEEIKEIYTRGQFEVFENFEWLGRYDRGRVSYWFAIDLINVSDKEWSGYFNVGVMNEMEFFVTNSEQESRFYFNKFEKGKGNDKSIFKSIPPITLPANEVTTVLIKTKAFSKIHQNTFQLSDTEFLLNKESSIQFNRYLYYGLFFGALFVLLLYYFFQFVIFNDLSYLFYSLVVTSIIVFFLREEWASDTNFEFLSPAFFEFKYYLPTTLFCYISHMLFVNHFLDARTNYPNIHRFIKICIPLMVIWFVIDRFLLSIDLWYAWEFMTYVKTIFMISCLVVLFTCSKSDDVLARFVLFGSLICVFGVILNIVVANLELSLLLGWLDLTHLISYSCVIGTLISFAIGLAYKRRKEQEIQYEIERALEKSKFEKEQLDRINKSKTTFFNQVTHDFKTPISIIRNEADKIEGQKQIKDNIQNSNNYLLNLINQILVNNQSEQEGYKPTYSQKDIIDLVKIRTMMFNSKAHSSKKELIFESKIDQLYMDVDALFIQRIIDNLMDNALKFTSANDYIKVQLEREDQVLILEVSDSGIGISAKEIDNIFEPYTQLDTDEKMEGVGLGLSVTKTLLEELGGTIDCSSAFGQGTSFTLRIPIRHESFPKTSEDTLVDDSTSVNENSSKIEILIVEDNLDLRRHLTEMIQDDYAMDIAENGALAWKKIQQNPPDIILSDVMMPIMDGLELCQLVKQNTLTSHIPFVFLTALSDQEQINKGLALGAHGYLTKPFDRYEVLLRIKNIKKQQERLAQYYRNKIENGNFAEESKDVEILFLKDLESLVLKHMDKEGFGVQQLVSYLGTNHVSLNKKIKSLTGYTTAKYIKSHKMKFAREQIINSQKTFSEIAFEIGISDPSNFTKICKKEFGFTPKDLREQIFKS